MTDCLSTHELSSQITEKTTEISFIKLWKHGVLGLLHSEILCMELCTLSQVTPGPANVGQELKKPGIFTLSKMRFWEL